ncbi:MAG TPA: hypothetical protein PLR18_00795 [bacterium]|nr:hypothetical protein [bacterium]
MQISHDSDVVAGDEGLYSILKKVDEGVISWPLPSHRPYEEYSSKFPAILDFYSGAHVGLLWFIGLKLLTI